MNQDSELKQLARAGAAIQRYTGRRPNRRTRLKSFDTAFDRYMTGLRYQRAPQEIVAAMAGQLEEQLDRDRLYARGEGPFRQRCDYFAQLFLQLMNSQPADRPVDTNFLRFARAAYGHLLMQTYEEIRSGRDALSSELEEEARQLNIEMPEDTVDEED